MYGRYLCVCGLTPVARILRRHVDGREGGELYTCANGHQMIIARLLARRLARRYVCWFRRKT